MQIIYNEKIAQEACKRWYGKGDELFGRVPELNDKNKIYNKHFVDYKLCDVDNPLLLVSSIKSIPDKDQVGNALTCFINIIFHPDKDQFNLKRKENKPELKQTEYTAQEIREILTKFVDEYLNRDLEELKRQKILRQCARTADPIDIVSECKNSCMWSEYKTTTGKLVFFPHVVLKQLQLLKESINDDLSFINRLLQDSGNVKLAQLHKFRGKDARKDNLKKFGNDSKVVAEKVKRKYGARGQEVKTDAVAVANRLKKQRKKKIRDLFALIQNEVTGGLKNDLKEYLTMNRVLNLDTKSLKINRRPGAGNYYRPATRRQTTPELRLKKKAIDLLFSFFSVS